MIMTAIVGILFMVVLAGALHYFVENIKYLHLFNKNSVDHRVERFAISLWNILENIERCAETCAIEDLREEILKKTSDRWLLNAGIAVEDGQETKVTFSNEAALPASYNEDQANGLQEVSHSAAIKYLVDGVHEVCSRELATHFCPVRQQDIEYTLYTRATTK